MQNSLHSLLASPRFEFALRRQEVSARSPEAISTISAAHFVGGAAREHRLMRSLYAVRVHRHRLCVAIRIRIDAHTVSVFAEPEFIALLRVHRVHIRRIRRIAVLHSVLRLQRLVITARIFPAVQLRADSRQRRQRVLYFRMRMIRIHRQIVFEAVYIEIVEIVPIRRARRVRGVLCLFLLLRRRRRPKRLHMRLRRVRRRLQMRSVARRDGLSRRRRRGPSAVRTSAPRIAQIRTRARIRMSAIPRFALQFTLKFARAPPIAAFIVRIRME